ncbi:MULTISPECIES: IS630 family transposase [unclassified Microcoleus]|uniref:IS630 family transposase n=1 Tax=unclassified Microcoleus TaxID=2642155 RepID=UPI001E03C941|nr:MULTISPECIES: IS630 family transposase [unclassified Microcoleus]MCC3442872.1 IS630 family transposase [Microcoleus sp. PH2017_03_ELD_O_A]TAE12242.1 MAG: IS630 family transposase [Oscillatoriales cyanobacterium]MCC3411921.1 IS630 family transposase [Microcoleus sp. PH2017_02_FOX_O_A]MCC3448562.1 IS630 family transposase [Microcoleus sp. PH2017_09_SFU_O_A]MCC3491466.1 IS630 family transposase [Microcoleus sp. PH2017_16_JOR_D_A]
MGNKFKVEIQETVEELEHRLKRAITAVSKEKLLLLYWIATKKIKTRKELATMLKRDSSTIYRWLRTYKQGGITSLLTVKKAPGKTPHIPPEVREKLIKKLQEPEGETSYGKLQIWLEKECGLKVSYKVVHDLVHYKLKSYLKVPRPQSNKVNEVAQANFKKKLWEIIKVMIKYFGTGQPVRIWCQDESRFGLITMQGRMITLKGIKPVGKKQWKRGNFYVYGVVEPSTGEQYYQEFSQLNHNCFQEFLNGFAEKYSYHFNLIIMDNGSFHKALLLDWHDHVMPIYLPAYSPELNPIERLWEHTKKDLKWANYSSLDKLKEQVDIIIKSLTNEEVLSLCGWDYILEAILSAGS